MSLENANPLAVRSKRAFVARRQLRSPAVILSLAVVVVLLACALVPHLIAPLDPYQQSLVRRL
ncbi:MAG: hypothetical protein QHC89_28555, partial [Bosea sp. (in: a-proteobacteria)]|nr:hypothetical protein [Bosea sp. (in: a-proteobacteria)]